MKPPRAEELSAMRARAYERDPVRRAEWERERAEEVKRLCSLISQAFQGVTLGNGIGLWEGQALDDYEDKATQGACRAQDEKEDWSRITSKDLNRCHSSLSFFDAEGMRFHLPAYLILDLQGGCHMGMVFHLAHAIANPPKFGLLSPEQRMSVRSYLLFLLVDPKQKHHHPDIQHALDHYWVCPPA